MKRSLSVDTVAQALRDRTPIEMSPMVAHFFSLPIASMLSIGVDPWIDIVTERPVALLNLMLAHPLLYEFFSTIPNLWIVLLEQVIRRETSEKFAHGYVFQMVQYHTLFEDGEDARSLLLSDCVGNRSRGHLEWLLGVSSLDTNDLFESEDKSFTSIIDLNTGNYNMDQDVIFLPFHRSDTANAKRPRLILVYVRLIRLLYQMDELMQYYGTHIDMNALDEYRLFEPLGRNLRKSLVITPIDAEHYEVIHYGRRHVIASKERGEQLIALVNEVYRLIDEIAHPEASKLDIQVYRDAIFGPNGRYNTSEKQRRLFLSELLALTRSRAGTNPSKKAMRRARASVIDDYGHQIPCAMCSQTTQLVDPYLKLAFCSEKCRFMHQ